MRLGGARPAAHRGKKDATTKRGAMKGPKGKGQREPWSCEASHGTATAQCVANQINDGGDQTSQSKTQLRSATLRHVLPRRARRLAHTERNESTRSTFNLSVASRCVGPFEVLYLADHYDCLGSVRHGAATP